MLKLVTDYFAVVLGIEPTEEEFKRTLATANYLKDNKLDNKAIWHALMGSGTAKVTGDCLSYYLWDGSLLEKDKYYYTGLFHIKSKPPTWNPVTFKEECEPFYKEMKIMFTMDDLLDYYYSNCRVPEMFRDRKRDAASFNFLLNKYRNADVESIDAIMYMISTFGKDVEKEFATQVFDIEQYKSEMFDFFRSIIAEAEINKANKIVWRE